MIPIRLKVNIMIYELCWHLVNVNVYNIFTFQWILGALTPKI